MVHKRAVVSERGDILHD